MPTAALEYLSGPPGTLSTPELDDQRQILLARALARIDRFGDAQSVWERLLDARSSRTRLQAVGESTACGLHAASHFRRTRLRPELELFP